MEDTYAFNTEKSAWLKKERGISFENIITLIENGKILRMMAHSNRHKYPNQFIYEIDVNGYVYTVPFVKNGTERFLKTIYPSRKATKKYLKEIRQ